MSLNGAHNLAAHFPTNAVPPDLGMCYISLDRGCDAEICVLGLKMYNGHTYMHTMLHMDVGDAINFPVYMDGLGEESKWWLGEEDKAHTLWLLLQCKDLEPLQKYLQEHFQLGPDINPINLGDLHITLDMFKALKTHSIQPYIVHQ